jgi:hypothetical protein
MQRCSTLLRWHETLLRKCLDKRCYPLTAYALNDDTCYDAFARTFNGCNDQCNIPTGPNPLLKRKNCYLELFANETEDKCFETPGDPMPHYINHSTHLTTQVPHREKARYCSIRVWSQLAEVLHVRSRLVEEMTQQNAQVEAVEAVTSQKLEAESATYLQRVSDMKTPPVPVECDMDLFR